MRAERAVSAAGPPPVPRLAVERPRVTDRFDQVGGGEIGAVVAPGGSGKSIVAAQWASQQRAGTVAWVELHRGSNDPIVFARELVDVLARVVPDAAGAFDDVFTTGSGVPGDRFAGRVLDLIADAGDDLTFVFDEAEHLEEETTTTAILDGLLDGLPANARGLIVGRWEPPMPFHRWRVEGRLHEIRHDDLAFDVDETDRLVRAVSGVALDRTSLRMLRERTDGWAVGLQLAALSIGRTDDPTGFVRAFAGTDAHVAEYLIEEVLDGLDPAIRRFLSLTAVLPWLTPELCAAVIEPDDGLDVHRALHHLSTHELFVLPVDAHGRRLRHHHLLGDLLRDELRRTDPGLEPVLRRRAADWLIGHGHLDDGVEQLLASGDANGVLALVRSHGPRCYERNEAATLVRWLAAVRDRTDDPRPEVEVHLLAAQVACHQVAGALATSRSLRRRHDLTHGERAAAEALRALLGLHDLAPTATDLAARNSLELLESLGPDDSVDVIGVGGNEMIELFAWYMRGQAAFHEGDLPRAEHFLERMLGCEEADYVVWKVYGLGSLALVRAWEGHLTDAERLGAAAVELADDAGIPHHVALAYGHHARALVAARRLDTAGARDHLARARPIVDRSGRAPLLGVHTLLRVATDAVEHGVGRALDELHRHPPPAMQPRSIDVALTSLHARLLLAAGQWRAAHDLIASVADGPDLHAVRVDVALAAGDCRQAALVLEAWRPSPGNRIDALARRVRAAALAWRAGSRATAATLIEESLAIAGPDGIEHVFIEAPDAVALLRAEPRLREHHLVEHILSAADGVYRPPPCDRVLPDPLTDRELEILRLLPSRHTNRELASALYISLNTLKTHLQHIYTKLGADDRDGAVVRAAALGLL